jgi:integrase
LGQGAWFCQSTINPARWRAHLKETYPATSKVRTVKHHAAVAIDDAATIYARLKHSDSMPALAFRFLILSAARAGEVMGAKWSEIDEKARIWTIPASRMKGPVFIGSSCPTRRWRCSRRRRATGLTIGSFPGAAGTPEGFEDLDESITGCRRRGQHCSWLEVGVQGLG